MDNNLLNNLQSSLNLLQQTQQTNAPNSFLGYYVNDYQTVLNTAVPVNGSAVLFANIDNNIIYSKKSINGNAYIQAYSINPVVVEGDPPITDPIPNNQIDEMKAILTEMKSIADEIKSVKEK